MAVRPTLAGASDDLFTVQAFLQSLSTGVPPTQPALSQAQEAASDLSVALTAKSGTVTMKTVSIGLMIAGALVAGAGIAYLAHNPKAYR